MKVEIKFSTRERETIYCWVATQGDSIGRGATRKKAIEDLKDSIKFNKSL